MARCHIALGGNLGPVAQTFARALSRLEADPHVALVRSSSVYRTQAVGDAACGDFLNAAAELETGLAPLELLDALQSIEAEFGRTRGERWGSRTLDLDLVLYGSLVIDEPRLAVPHPACWYRRFVLDPLCEIAPGAVHPLKAVSIAELRGRLLERPLRVMVAGDANRRKQVIASIGDGDPRVEIGEWGGQTDFLPTFIAWLGSSDRAGFESLPVLPRLDLSREADPARALRHVLAAALDEPRIEGPATIGPAG